MRHYTTILFGALSLFLHITLCAQTPRLWGLTPQGGANGGGSIFSLNADGTGYQVQHSFNASYDGQSPEGQVVWATDGKIYGTTTGGGMPGQGVLFSYDTATSVYTDLFDFYDTMGRYPTGTMIQASNGLLYGTTSNYGFFNSSGTQGVLFSYDPINHIYKRLQVLPTPLSDVVEGPGEKLYGVTGNNIFNWNINADSVHIEYTFGNNIVPSGMGALVKSPFDSLLYATGYNEMSDSGFIYTFNPVNSNVSVIYTGIPFHYPNSYAYPANDMVITDDSTIYGCTSDGCGSCQGEVTFYSCNIHTNTFVLHYDFGQETDGYGVPPAGAALGPDGKIYLMSGQGFNGIWVFDPHIGNLTQFMAFDSTDDASGGKLRLSPGSNFYGLCEYGGFGQYNNGNGFLFSFKPGVPAYKKYFNFYTSTGYYPCGSLTLAQGKLFGTLYKGGEKGGGGIFSFAPATGSYNMVYSFDSASGFNSGYFGNSTDLVLGRDGKLYGINQSRVTNGYPGGCIFSLDPATNVYKVLYAPTATDIFGGIGTGGLIQLADGKLYGTGQASINAQTWYTVFSFDPDSLIFKCLDTLAGTQYFIPQVPVAPTLAANGLLYFETSGSVFSYNMVIHKIQIAFNFNDTTGNTPFCALLAANDGMLYGTCSDGGDNNCGTLFRFNPTSNTCTALYNFGVDNEACAPWNSLTQASDGMLYGSTQHGGIILGYCSGGDIYKFDPVADTINFIHNFNYQDGITPQCLLTQLTTCQQSGSAQNQAVCQGQVYSFNNRQLTAAGIYTDTVSSLSGCDSVISLTLIVDSVNAIVSQLAPDSLYVTPTINASIQWFNCSTNTPINGATHNTFVPAVSGTYKVVVAGTQCTDTSNCVNAIVSGIENIVARKLNVYPNPNNTNTWQVEVSPELANGQCQIFDVDGKVVYTTRLTGTSNNITTNLAAGVYIMRISVNENTYSIKLVQF